MATSGYMWLLLLVVCCTGYNAAPTDTSGRVQRLDRQLAALYSGSNSSETERLQQLDILMKSNSKDYGPQQEMRDAPAATVYKDCQDAYSRGLTTSDIYNISPNSQNQMKVFCDQASSNGGWTVIQRRADGMEDFDRTWIEYKDGFGTTEGDYYLGNDNIHLLTTIRPQKLRVELHHQGHGFAYAEYSFFKIETEFEKYKISLGDYTGTNSPGDSLTYHNGQLFSTRDQDNDQDGGHCADWFSSGWWFKDCSKANLNGVYASTSEKGVTWSTWLGSTTSLTTVKMMVKPADAEVTTTTTTTTSTTTPTTQPETTRHPNTPTTRPTTTPTTEPETTRPTTTPTTTAPTTTSSKPMYRDCQDAYTKGQITSGIYRISPNGTSEVDVYCEMGLENGGWTVFQRRINGTVDFYRAWKDYKEGFGSAQGEHWIGNDHLHQLTARNDTQLLVELEYGGETQYASYTEFWVLSEDLNYTLHVAGYTGGSPPGDSLQHPTSWGNHTGMAFTTRDRDNDLNSGGNCAHSYYGGWWYNRCYGVNLNGRYDGNIQWLTWGDGSLSATRMMLKTK